MKDEQPPSAALQENLLVLLCFNEQSIPVIANNVDIDLFEGSIFREIASEAIHFYQQFKKPIAEHLPDVFEDLLKSKEPKAEIYLEAIKNLYENKDVVNVDYTLHQLERFVDSRLFMQGLKKSLLLVEEGDIDGAKQAIDTSRKRRMGVFDPGIFFGKDPRTFNFNNWQDNIIYTGIKELDEIECCPAPKELYIFVGMPNYGKTWFLIHLAKIAILQHKRVLHISLEMSKEKVSMRYVMSLFAIPKRRELESKRRAIFHKDEMGRFASLDFETLRPSMSMADTNFVQKTMARINKTIRRPNLLIQDFPTRSLTMEGLRAYMENLMSFHKFKADLILIDSPDLMYLDPKNLRLEMMRNWQDIRGFGGEYEAAMVGVSQTNRDAEGVRWITRKYLAEDYSKIQIGDNVITYNQSPLEYKYGLARILVDKGRNDRKGDKMLLSQNYETGQFCLDSIRLSEKYWDVMARYGEKSRENE